MSAAVDRVLRGSVIKLNVSMLCEGFSMDDDDWMVSLRAGGIEKAFSKDTDGVAQSDDGQWYLVVDTSEFGNGRLLGKLTAFVDDADCKGGIRTETLVVDTGIVIIDGWVV